MNVNFDDIEVMAIDYGGGSVYYYNNQPFTGSVVEYINDVLVGEMTVVNGNIKGRVILYYSNGKIMEEHYESYNRPYGKSKKWDENGNLIKETDFGAEYKP